jgi:hypothetical protein
MSRSRSVVLLALFASALVVARTGADADEKAKPADYAAELPHIPPKSPEESLKSFRLRPGFRIELAAAEPLLASPVALDFDEDGRLYVAEFLEFNQSASKQAHGRGRVRRLEDTDGDGVYDTTGAPSSSTT